MRSTAVSTCFLFAPIYELPSNISTMALYKGIVYRFYVGGSRNRVPWLENSQMNSPFKTFKFNGEMEGELCVL